MTEPLRRSFVIFSQKRFWKSPEWRCYSGFGVRNRTVGPQTPCSSQNSGQVAKNFVHDSLWYLFESFAATGFHVDCLELIATHNTGGTYAGTIQRHRKAGSTGKIASAGHGYNNRQAGHAIKGLWCDNQHRSRSRLLMTCGRVKSETSQISPLFMSDFLLTNCRRIQPL